MIATIIRCNPGQHRGALRGYTVTQIRDGARTSIDVIARNGRDAVNAVRALAAQPSRPVAA